VTLTAKLPSIGCLAVLFTNIALVAFLFWGFREPALHRVWELHHELEIGTVGKLSSEDHALLSAELAEHDELAEALLSDGAIGLISANSDGWLETPDATAIRSAKAGAACVMDLEVRVPQGALPIVIEARGFGWQRRTSIARQGLTRLPLPDAGKVPEIITLEVASKGGDGKLPEPGIRVGFECQGAEPKGRKGAWR